MCYKRDRGTVPGESRVTRIRAELHEQSESGELQLRSFTKDLRLATVTDIARALSAHLSQEQLLALIMDRLTRALDADRSTLFLVAQNGQELWSTVTHGQGPRLIAVRFGQGLPGWVAATGRGINVKDAYLDSRFDPHGDEVLNYRTNSVLCQPVFDSDGNLIAVAQVSNKRQGWFTVEDESLLRTIMAMAAISIVNAKLHQALVVQNVALTDTQRRLADKVSEIDLLFDLERQAGQADNLDALITLMLHRIAAAVPVGLLQIGLPTSTGGMVVHRLQPRRSDTVELVVMEGQPGLLGRVLESGHGADVCRVDSPAMTHLALAERLPFTPHSGLCLPLQQDGTTVGVLAVYDPPGRIECLTAADAKLLILISGQVARAVSHRQAREQAARQDRLSAIGGALASVMHDFRTPMTVASGSVQLLKREEDADERAHLADDVLRQLARMMQMTREVLAFARGEQTVLMSKVQMAEFGRDATDLVRQVFAGSTAQVEVRCPERGTARLDAGKLLRVVQNIARNAREALDDRSDGRFELDIEGDGEQLVLTFADNGAGVAMAFRHRMFEAFATQGKKDGTGLGLAMVKQIAEAHGGSVTYRDTPGGGATFEIRIDRNPTPEPIPKLEPPSVPLLTTAE